MRSIRRLGPRQEDNFALNQLSMLTQSLDKLFVLLNFIGWILGGFAILVGGFGLANIMFVSVRERTNIIGIKKALGASRGAILMEFLLESIMLCLIGGIIGLLWVLIGIGFANYFFNVGFVLLVKNIILGIGLSVIIGIIAGMVPAIMASLMDPVEAIRFK